MTYKIGINVIDTKKLEVLRITSLGHAKLVFLYVLFAHIIVDLSRYLKYQTHIAVGLPM